MYEKQTHHALKNKKSQHYLYYLYILQGPAQSLTTITEKYLNVTIFQRVCPYRKRNVKLGVPIYGAWIANLMASQYPLSVTVPVAYWCFSLLMRPSSLRHLLRLLAVRRPHFMRRMFRLFWLSSSLSLRMKCHIEGLRTLTILFQRLW